MKRKPLQQIHNVNKTNAGEATPKRWRLGMTGILVGNGDAEGKYIHVLIINIDVAVNLALNY